MKYFKPLTQEQIIQRAIEDPKVKSALEDLIRAMSVYGREGVTGDNLLNVIMHRMIQWADYEEPCEDV